MTLIYKILRTEEWQDLSANGETLGAPIDVADGYIHFSTSETIAETVSKYFHGVSGLKILAYDDQTITGPLKYEESRNCALFPHLYAPLKLHDALWIKDLTWRNDQHEFPAGVL